MKPRIHTPHRKRFRWKGLPVLKYKSTEGTHFRDITRQVLFDDEPKGVQLRYFEVSAGGHSTLEWHRHSHAVVVIRGGGRALVGNSVHRLRTFDLIRVPPRTWHQFRASPRQPLGFLCTVLTDRDKPRLPSAATLRRLRSDATIARFVRV